VQDALAEITAACPAAPPAARGAGTPRRARGWTSGGRPVPAPRSM